MTKFNVVIENAEFSFDENDLNNLNVSCNDDKIHVLESNKAYEVQLLQADYPNKTIKLSVNGREYSVKIEDEFDQQLKKMGLLTVSTQKMNSIKAPMPGLIVAVMVEIGQEISEGTPLLVLSAMKMENIILSQGDGIIKSIEVKKDDAVEKGQLIIEIE